MMAGSEAKVAAREGGDGSVANVGVLPVPLLPISNWGLKLDIGNTGDTGNTIPSALLRPHLPPRGMSDMCRRMRVWRGVLMP